MNATIYNANGEQLTTGLQSRKVCDEAIQTAKSLASDLDQTVYLEDGEDKTTVHPDGSTEDGWDW